MPRALALGIGERVLFPGHVRWQDTPDWLVMCDVMTVPSVIDANGNVDGLPNVLLEAMASGRPVIGSDVAGIPSVIADGHNGLLCPPGDAEALAERLQRLLTDAALCERLGAQARQDMLDAYDWSTIAERMVAIYQQAIQAAGWKCLPHHASIAPSAAWTMNHCVPPKRARYWAMLHAAEIDPTTCNCLDVGCAYGLITKHLTPVFKGTLGLEYDAEALETARLWSGPDLCFLRGDGLALPIADESVAVVVCAQVYEHIGDPEQLFREVWRVLAPGGVCVFTGPNRLFPFEFHSRLLFVHWLPFAWTRWLVRILGRGDAYDAQMLALPALRRLLARFAIRDMIVEILRDPERFSCGAELGRLAWVGRLPAPMLRGMLPFMPNFNWLLTKPRDGRGGTLMKIAIDALGDQSAGRWPLGDAQSAAAAAGDRPREQLLAVGR